MEIKKVTIKTGGIRLGQKLCNWIQDQGFSRENVHIKLFHMTDKEFMDVLDMKVDYEIPHTKEGEKIIKMQADAILGSWKEKKK